MKRRKYSKKRNSKKNNIFKKMFFAFCGFIFLLIIVFSALYQMAPNFKIKGLEIIGNETLPQEEVKKAAQDLFVSSFNILGQEIMVDNIFLSFKGKTNELMERFPEIENIIIKKDFSKGMIYLEIQEKEPAVIWCDNQECSLLDKKASFIRNSNREEGFVLIQEKEEREFNKQETINSVLKLDKKLKEYNLNTQEYDLFLEKLVAVNNCNFIFNLDDSFDWQVEKIDIVLKQEKYINNLNNYQYIDLRFGNQAIVK
jgi:cell division septal protein FtsQ